MRVIVTRPAAQAAPWVRRLRDEGIDAASLPLIAIAPPADPAAVAQAWHRLDGATLAMFVSANAVEGFWAARPPGVVWPPALRAGSTGPGTTQALLDAGVARASIVEPAADAPAFDSEALWARLEGEDWRGRRVLVVRGEGGRDWFADTLRSRGAEVGFVAAYRRSMPVADPDARTLIARALAVPQSHCWHFSSSEAAQALAALEPGADWSASLALATHPRIVQSVRAIGFGRVEAVEPGLPALLQRVPSIEFGRP
jgi:uroporphyrinogen-III synthase